MTDLSKQEEQEKTAQEARTDLNAEIKEELVPEEKSVKNGAGFGTGFLTGILAALICVMVFLLGWTVAGKQQLFRHTQSPETETGQGAEVLTNRDTLYKLNEVQNLIESHYLNEVDSEELSSYLFKGIAVGLDDPYANYYTKEELASVIDASRGAYIGIGAVISYERDEKQFSVNEVYEDSAAMEAGLQAGDILLEMNGNSMSDMDLDELVTKIKAMDGEFTFTVKRPGTEENLELQVTCTNVEVPVVTSVLLTDQIGYIRLTEFTQAAVSQFSDALKALQKQGMKQLVVDLRDNPGGLLNAVCDILDEVLPKCLLVYTEDKDGVREEYSAGNQQLMDGTIAVLVNGNSASASEIFAGAIQDYKVGPVIGTTTYGKGVVQMTYTLSDGSAFKMTTETYFTPLGQDIDGNGITPDIEMPEADETDSADETDPAKDVVVQKAVEVLSGLQIME